MKRIVVIADTHFGPAEIKLPTEVVEALKMADIIVHAGDFTCGDMLKYMQSMGDLRGVQGNMDSKSIRAQLPERLAFEVGGVKIGVIHGERGPVGFIDRVAEAMKDLNCQLVICAHTHNAFIEKRGGTTFLNPGSPTDKRFAKKNSYAIIEIADDGKIIPNIKEVKS
jgi:putative phosphoesterase